MSGTDGTELAGGINKASDRREVCMEDEAEREKRGRVMVSDEGRKPRAGGDQSRLVCRLLLVCWSAGLLVCLPASSMHCHHLVSFTSMYVGREYNVG